MKEMSPQDAGGHTFPANDILHIGLLVGSITSRCSGKWARTQDRTRETAEIEPTYL